MFLLRGHFFLVLILASLLKAEEPEEPIVSVENVKAEDDIAYLTPNQHPDVYFADHFDDEEQFNKKWIKSQAKKAGAEEAIAKYDGEWSLEKAQKDPRSTWTITDKTVKSPLTRGRPRSSCPRPQPQHRPSPRTCRSMPLATTKSQPWLQPLRQRQLLDTLNFCKHNRLQPCGLRQPHPHPPSCEACPQGQQTTLRMTPLLTLTNWGLPCLTLAPKTSLNLAPSSCRPFPSCSFW